MLQSPARRALVLAGVLATSTVPTALAAQSATAAPRPAVATAVDPSLRAIDSLLSATYPAGGPGAAVVVARGDRILLRKGYGLGNVELGVPMTPEHVFRLGSITKQFTAVAVLMLAEEGKLALDDEITRFFPDWPTHGHTITVEHLLTHTSGIRSYTGMPAFGDLRRRDLTLQELVAVFRDEPMDFAPGSDFRYNNSGYVLLGAIIEQLSGQPYAEFVRSRIFEPLGMTDTRFEDLLEVTPRRVAGYGLGEGRRLRNAEYLSMSAPHAAGALISTVDDQLRWQRAVAGRRLLSGATWERAFTPVRLSDGRGSGYGYGWFIGTTAGQRTVEHGGDINGFSTDGLWVPGADVHVIVLSNVERSFANPAEVTQRAAARILGAPPAPAAGAGPPLDEYAGVYRISDSERRLVFVEGDTLFSVRGEGPRQAMRRLGADEFEYLEGATRVTFQREGEGRITAMLLRPRLGPDQLPASRTGESVDSIRAAAERTVSVPREVLESYAGEYELGPNFIITISRAGDGLVAQATGQPQVTLRARSELRFSIVEVPAALEFQKDGDGAVTGLVLEQGGRRMPARKIR